MFGGDSVPGGFHQDVMSANPTDDASRKRLSEEIKTRAKGALQTKNYPEAATLYGKAIDVMAAWQGTDDKTETDAYSAILHANRSMCYLGMNSAEKAETDGKRAIELDSSYVKGYYRLGMAFVKLLKWEEARDVFTEGLKRKSDDKDLLAQLEKVTFAIANPQSTPRPKAATVPKARTTVATTTGANSSSVSAVKPKVPTSSLPTKTTTSCHDDVGGGEAMRGYKLTSDGRKTTFFNHEMDDKTKALIGDITPKKLDVAAPAVTTTNSTGSAWNTAGTFESTSLSQWAHDFLSKKLQETQVSDNMCVVKVTSAAITGDGEVVVARGKRKHIYDFCASLEWSAFFNSSTETIKGKLTINDIEADEDAEYDFRDYTLTTSKVSPDQSTRLQQLLASRNGQLQKHLSQVCDNFRTAFKAK